jgi:hypothetical protein
MMHAVGDVGDHADCGTFGQACYKRLKGFGSAADSAHARPISHQSSSNRLTDAGPSAGHEGCSPHQIHQSIVEPTRVLEQAVFFLGGACPG